MISSDDNFRRCSVIQNHLELALSHMAAARRECWLELAADDPLRDQELADAIDRAHEELGLRLVRINSARMRMLRAR